MGTRTVTPVAQQGKSTLGKRVGTKAAARKIEQERKKLGKKEANEKAKQGRIVQKRLKVSAAKAKRAQEMAEKARQLALSTYIEASSVQNPPDKIFECPSCPMKFVSQSNICRHLWEKSCSGNNGKACNICFKL